MSKSNAPVWLKISFFYQIYPQSFCDSNADGIGDIPGIIQKLKNYSYLLGGVHNHTPPYFSK